MMELLSTHGIHEDFVKRLSWIEGLGGRGMWGDGESRARDPLTPTELVRGGY